MNRYTRDTHHYVFLNDIWVFTHRLNKENLRKEEEQIQISVKANTLCNLPEF